MEHETHIVQLTDEEIAEIRDEIHAWKEQYGDVYITEFDEETSYVWRCLTQKEFKRAMEFFEDDFERAEYVCKLCVLDPTEVDYSNDMMAGIPELLTEYILRQSGFSEDSSEMESLMSEYEREMQMFSNQIACVIVEAFNDLSIEEVEDWNLKKMLWYYSRAKWTLEVLRGISLQRDEGGEGTLAPDGTMVKGDPRDFPELLK